MTIIVDKDWIVYSNRAFRAAHDNVSPNSNVAMASSGRILP